MIHEDDIIVGQKIQILSGDFKGLEGSIIDFKTDENGNLLNDEIEVHIKDSNMVKIIDRKNLRMIDPWKNFGSRLQPIREKKIVSENLYEQDGDGVFSEAHARELLVIQADYNKKIQQLNTELAKKKSDLSIKYMKIAQQQTAQKTAQQQARQNVAQSQQQQQTGTVDNTGRPVTSAGTPPPIVDSYQGILRVKKTLAEKIDFDSEERFTSQLEPRDTRNWYEKQRDEKAEKERLKSLPKKKKWTQKQSEREEDIQYEIDDLEQQIKDLEARLNPDMGWEIEEFFAELGLEVADILNSGISDTDKLTALKAAGVSNPRSILSEYQNYYPSDKEREDIENQIMELTNERNKLQVELDGLHKMYEYKSSGSNSKIISMTHFTGFKDAAKGFEKFVILDYINDPGYGYEDVKMMLIYFTKLKEHGLCIYNEEERIFIEEPATLEDYDTTLEQLYAKYGLKSTLEELEGPLNESIYSVANADKQELQNLKDYLDAEEISYIEDEESETIEFDEDELDDEWRDQLRIIGLEDEDSSDILSVEDDDFEEEELEDDEEILTDEEERIDKDKVIYVRIDDNGDTVVGKIYKLFDDGEWRSKIVNGESETFEKLNYDPDWDEIDIVAFLRDNYEDADIMEEDEYNEYLGESWNAAAKIAGGIAGKEMVDKFMDDDEEEITEVCEDEEELSEKHSIPTLEDFLKE